MAIELHFYPGQNLLVVLDVSKKGTYILRNVEAMGGPPRRVDYGSGSMPANPTSPGDFVIDKVEAYRTPTWGFSRIKWGTSLQDKPDPNGIKSRDDVWYKTQSGKWASLKNDYNIERTTIIDAYYDLYGFRKVPEKWVFNDFGPVAIRWYEDKNRNKKLDSGERLSGEMIHTTPEDEAASSQNLPVILQPSHGCIHIKPNDRDVLLKTGAFKSGTRLKIYKYHEVFQI